jgi:hypothetical protein
MTPAVRKKITIATSIFALCGIAGLLLWNFTSSSLPNQILGRGQSTVSKGTSLEKTETPSKPSESEATGPNQALKLKFELIGGWNYVEGKTPVPDNIQQLNGKLVEVTGFMMPINYTQNIKNFILIQSLWGCCFGQAPAPNHIIVVNMQEGKTVDFYPDPVRVIGTFSVGETREEGYLVSIYQVTGQKVIAK